MVRLYTILLMLSSFAVGGLILMQQSRGPGGLLSGEWGSFLSHAFDRGRLIDTLKSLPESKANNPLDKLREAVGVQALAANSPPPNLTTNEVVRLERGTTPLCGRVLAWDDFQLVLLSDRGELCYVPWSEQKNLTKTEGPLQALPSAQLQAELQTEFGRNFVVRTSAQFVVVQPKTCQRDWARAMQQFYGNIQTYCSARQIPMQSPQFPLVAIVMPNRQSMLRYAAEQKDEIGPNFLAYYSLRSNRVLMYDAEQSKAEQSGGLDLETVFHEAFHQVAFNTRLHKRTAAPPLWVSEGMASAFETPGMSDHRRSRTIADRIHPHQQRLFLEYAEERDFADNVSQMVEADSLFQTDSTRAYALAWAMAFYWMEHAPHTFAQYLHTVNQRAAFTEYGPERRRREFESLAQCSIAEFATRIKSYHERLAR
ncbi:MAG: DUF1570 domain-containing protein [Planctomycetaceae bacterium]|nr:DUF1570 domain-containing protein [Planctomycetaceae bacterium]